MAIAEGRELWDGARLREIYINGTPPFTYRTDATMPPSGETVLRVSLLQFVKKDGERFNPMSHAVTTVWIGGNGYDYRSFSMGR